MASLEGAPSCVSGRVGRKVGDEGNTAIGSALV
jgi:hypothetical protein